MTSEEPRSLLVQARGEPSPLCEPEDPAAHDDLGAFTRAVPLDDDRLALPAEWMSADVAQSSGNDAFQQWFARNPKGLDGWLSRMRGKFGKNGDRGK
ncbi:hypothetical protein ACWC2H_38660 [Streptomyces sp. 900105755]